MNGPMGEVVDSARSMFRRVVENGATAQRGSSPIATDGHEGVAFGPRVALAMLLRPTLRPRVDVWEGETVFTVVVDLPGMTRDAIRVVASSDGIVIAGERRVERPHDARVRRAERKVGHFERAVRLGAGARPENATVRFEAGVLEIRVPKGPGARGEPRKIDLPPN